MTVAPMPRLQERRWPRLDLSLPDQLAGRIVAAGTAAAASAAATAAAAAVTAVGILGDKAPERRGDCLRALARELDAPNVEQRRRVRKSLVRLSGRDYGDNVDQWRAWVSRLP